MAMNTIFFSSLRNKQLEAAAPENEVDLWEIYHRINGEFLFTYKLGKRQLDMKN